MGGPGIGVAQGFRCDRPPQGLLVLVVANEGWQDAGNSICQSKFMGQSALWSFAYDV